MKKIFSLLLILILMLSLTACGTSNTDGGSTPAAETPAEKHIVNLGITAFPTNTNPFTQTMQADHNALRMYESLVQQDAATLEFKGVLADSWSVSDDGLGWTIKLKEGVKWHDGETFDADDVMFTYSAILDNLENENAGFSRKSDVKSIEKIEKKGDYEVLFTTKTPVANFLDTPLQVIYIVPEHIFGKMSVAELIEFTNSNPIGTSPWKLVGEFNAQNTELEFERNEDYYGTKPNVDGLLFILFENSDTMYQAFKAGSIDMFSPSGTQAEELATDANVEVIKNLQPKLTEIGVNSSDDPRSTVNKSLKIKEVRQAINLALDKQKLIDDVLKGVGYAGTTIVPTSAGKWHLEGEHEYSPEKAIALLEKAGFTDFETVQISGRDVKVRKNAAGDTLVFRLALLTDGYAWHYRDSALYIVKWLEEVGIGLELQSMDGSALGDLMDLESDSFCDYDLYIWGWTPGYDPGFILTVLTTDQIGGRQEVMYSNPEYDALVDLQITQVNVDERLKTVHKAQEIILEDAPYIPLYYQGAYDAFRKDKYEGFIQFAGDGTIFNNETYINIKPVAK
ncbi:ABC transporter substrate-binding protein [Fusibacter sp. 3D3]|uniref:ABC transporter substrate-binding protein n=1 Tax=Fusibacter sp. 3D3 TaxID=1048380 RepID=UPI000852B165|nr:ABC transporter substrate-binding protein [Fusibacter sp. 3D3]GAU75948.1 oligopeptide ABC transporter periplasmic oligopeptide-binding protein OppA [Fusibacter sp. 3D3]